MLPSPLLCFLLVDVDVDGGFVVDICSIYQLKIKVTKSNYFEKVTKTSLIRKSSCSYVPCVATI